MAEFTDAQLKEYARHIIRDHAYDVEFLSINEMAKDFFGEDLSNEDARRVDYLVSSAVVDINWKEDN